MGVSVLVGAAPRSPDPCWPHENKLWSPPFQSQLINEYVRPGSAVFDMACGKASSPLLVSSCPFSSLPAPHCEGRPLTRRPASCLPQGGDLLKFDAAGASRYVGIDIAPGSVRPPLQCMGGRAAIPLYPSFSPPPPSPAFVPLR